MAAGSPTTDASQAGSSEPLVHILWMNGGLGCDGDSVALTAATQPSIEEIVLVVEGSIPNEAIKEEGYWCGFGNNPATGQPMTTNEWLDRLAPKATAILAVGTCATYGGIHAMAGQRAPRA